MILEEAILHAEEVAEENEKNAQFYEYRFSYRKVEYYQKKADECLKCASEHRQLAEWLRELKGYREARQELEDRHAVGTLDLIDSYIEEVNADEERE